MSFQPAMLTLAREAEGLTQVALAQQVNVSQAFLSQVEHGFKKPTSEFVEKVAVRLDRPVSFFELTNPVLGDGIVDFFHRKRATLPAKPLRRAHANANVIRIELDRAFAGLELANILELPSLPIHEHGDPTRVARLVRAMWRVPDGPLLNLSRFIEAMGVPVIVTNLGHAKLSAISLPLMYGTSLILVNSQLPATHQRFALAHELGHLVMHRSLTELGSDLESEADQFAAELLTPAAVIAPELRQLKFSTLGPLKQRWHVSMSALVYRAKSLGQISADAATLMYKRLSSLSGGPHREPGEPDPERPTLVVHVLHFMLDKLSYTYAQLAALMEVSEHRLRSFYLHEPIPNLRVVDSSRPRHLVPLPSTDIGP